MSTPAPEGSEGPSSDPGRMMRILDRVERIGNALPAPVTIFFLFSIAVLVLSWMTASAGVTAEHPGTGDTLTAVNLLSQDGLYRMITEAVQNFTDFAPLGTVLVVMIGIGVAEHSGLISTGLRQLMAWTPKSLVTATLVFAGIMSSMAADAGYVVLTPLGAVLFAGMGRHPIAGLAAAFAGVSAGYSANLLITGLDPLLAGFTEEAAVILDGDYRVHAAANWYFMIVSVPIMTVVGALVTTRIVEPRLGPWSPADPDAAPTEHPEAVTPREKRALLAAGGAFLFSVFLAALLVVPPQGILRSATIDVNLVEGIELAEAAEVEAQAAAGADPERRVLRVELDRTRDPGDIADVQAVAAAWESALGAPVEVAPAPEGRGTPRAEELITDYPGHQTRIRLFAQGEPRLLAVEDPGRTLEAAPLRDHPAVRSAGRGLTPFYNNMVPILLVAFFLPGLAYGLVARTIRDDKAVERMTGETMATMGTYIVLAFVAAQFVAYFSWSNLGLILAVKGAELLDWIGIGGIPLILGFIVVSALLNIFIGSASAKWGIMAPVFVPMLMQSGYSPELVQVAYRIGDSVTNIITPLLPYFPIIIAFAQKYDKKSGLGTLISAMLPYSVAFSIAWAILLVAWMLGGFPLGPGAPLTYGG